MEIVYLKAQLRESDVLPNLRSLLEDLKALPQVEDAFVVPILALPEWEDVVHHHTVWIRAKVPGSDALLDLATKVAQNPKIRWAEPSTKTQRSMLMALEGLNGKKLGEQVFLLAKGRGKTILSESLNVNRETGELK